MKKHAAMDLNCDVAEVTAGNLRDAAVGLVNMYEQAMENGSAVFIRTKIAEIEKIASELYEWSSTVNFEIDKTKRISLEGEEI